MLDVKNWNYQTEKSNVSKIKNKFLEMKNLQRRVFKLMILISDRMESSGAKGQHHFENQVRALNVEILATKDTGFMEILLL